MLNIQKDANGNIKPFFTCWFSIRQSYSLSLPNANQIPQINEPGTDPQKKVVRQIFGKPSPFT
jgi:hypothetical protein